MDKRLIKGLLYRTVVSWRLYFAVLIYYFSALLSLKDNTIWFLDNTKQIGALNLFIFSNVVDNQYVPMLTPFLSIFCFVLVFFDDLHGKYYYQYITKMKLRHYFHLLIGYSSITGGLFFLFSQISMMLVFALIDQHASPMIISPSMMGYFSPLYARSMLLYIIAFMIHSFCIGFIFAFWGCGMVLCIPNKLTIYLISICLSYFSYNCVILFEGIFPDKNNFFRYLFPTYLFEIRNNLASLAQHLSQLLVMLAISLLLIIIGFRRIRDAS